MSLLLIFRILIVVVPLATIGAQYVTISYKNTKIEELASIIKKREEQIEQLKVHIVKVEKALKQAGADVVRARSELNVLKSRKKKIVANAKQNPSPPGGIIRNTIDELYSEPGQDRSVSGGP